MDVALKNNRRRVLSENFCILMIVATDILAGFYSSSILSVATIISIIALFVTLGLGLNQEESLSDFIKDKFRKLCAPYFISGAFITFFNIITCVVIDNDYTLPTFTKILGQNVVKYFFGYSYSSDLSINQVLTVSSILYLLPCIFIGLVLAKLIVVKINNITVRAIIGITFLFIPVAFNTSTVFPFGISMSLFSVPFILIGNIISNDKFKHYLDVKYLPIYILIFLAGCVTNIKNDFWSMACNTEDVIITSLYGIAFAFIVNIIANKLTRITVIDYLKDFSVSVFAVFLFNKYAIFPYEYKFIEVLKLPDKIVVKLILEVVFIALSFIIVKLADKFKFNKPSSINEKRNPNIDILRAILIILMILGHSWYKDALFTNIVYSFHMLAFIMVSGYFYKHNDNLKSAVFKNIKSLLPYCSFSLLYILINDYGTIEELKTVILSVSYTKNILSAIPTIGPVYFITLLFCTKLIYIFIDRIKSELAKHIIVFTLSIFAIFLGASGYWLPWSLDCSIYCLLFYHIAYNLRKYDLLNKLNEYKAVVLILCSIWYLHILNGGMELAIRNYGNLGYTIFGAVSAFIVTYILSDSLSKLLPKIFVEFLKLTGESTLYILIIHTFFFGVINNFIERKMGFNGPNIFSLTIGVFFQIIFGIVVYIIVAKLKVIIKSKIKVKKEAVK